jgi:hypothetical protein
MTGKQERIRLGKGCLTTRELTIGSVNEARCSLLIGMQVSRLGSVPGKPTPLLPSRDFPGDESRSMAEEASPRALQGCRV